MLAKHAFDECTVEMMVTAGVHQPNSMIRVERSFRAGHVHVTTTALPLSSLSPVVDRLEGDIEVRIVRLRGQEMTRDQLSTFYDLLAGLCMDRLVELRSGER